MHTVAQEYTKARACLIAHGGHVTKDKTQARVFDVTFPGFKDAITGKLAVEKFGYATLTENGKTYAVGVTTESYPLKGKALRAFIGCTKL